MVLCLPDGATWAHWIFAITFVAKCIFSFGLLLVLIFGPCGVIDYNDPRIVQQMQAANVTHGAMNFFMRVMWVLFLLCFVFFCALCYLFWRACSSKHEEAKEP